MRNNFGVFGILDIHNRGAIGIAHIAHIGNMILHDHLTTSLAVYI
jgi:hypothetical protein